MAHKQLVIGLAGTFIGLTAVLVISGIVVNPILLFVAIPFGVAAYLLWEHASGRLADRIRRRASQSTGRERARARRRARAKRNGRRATASARGERFVGGGSGGRGSGGNGRGSNGRRSGAGDPRDRAPRTNSGPTVEEAYATLGLDPSASAGDVRRAYREQAKELHPDSADGDEEAFKELTAAYELLDERAE
ncbi:MAG: J domain-containing protein [Halopenitus sp.]